MKYLSKVVFAALLAVVLFPCETSGQPGGPVFISPEVQKDRTVTFRFLAPNAKEVKLSTQFITGQQNMTKDDKGIWSITLGPVEPDIYPYCFIVDGIQVADPKNSWIFPNEGFQNSLIEIPAETRRCTLCRMFLMGRFHTGTIIQMNLEHDLYLFILHPVMNSP